jgi:hypothetical protein
MTSRTPLILLALAPTLVACPSLTNFHSARPIAAGKTQLAIDGMVEGVNADLLGDNGGDNAVIPNIEIQVRHGVSETWDFGVKAFPVGVQADFNFLLKDTGGFALSVDPAISAFVMTGGAAFYPWVALLMDIGNPESVVVTVGPRVGAALITEGGAGLLFGGVLGVKLQLSESFHIMPEATAYGLTGTGGGLAVVWTGGVSFAFFL